MSAWMRTLHKWTGLILAIQFLLWMLSGLVMSLLDHDAVQGHGHRAESAAATPSWPAGTIAPDLLLAAAKLPVRSIDTFWLRGQPLYRLSSGERTWLVDARSGTAVAADSASALAIATADYAGSGKAGIPQAMQETTTEVRNHQPPFWRIDFDDDDATTIYVSAQDGRIVERRNDAWRLFDLAWMLHIMDYGNRSDFNNPLVVTAAAGGLWIALTGVWLLVANLRFRRFAIRRVPAEG